MTDSLANTLALLLTPQNEVIEYDLITLTYIAMIWWTAEFIGLYDCSIIQHRPEPCTAGSRIVRLLLSRWRPTLLQSRPTVASILYISYRKTLLRTTCLPVSNSIMRMKRKGMRATSKKYTEKRVLSGLGKIYSAVS